MKNGFIYAYVSEDSPFLSNELKAVAPAAIEPGYRLYSLEEYLFATESNREWYDIMLYEADMLYGYVETKSSRALTTPRFIHAGPFQDNADTALVLEQSDRDLIADREGNITKTNRLP